MVLCEVDVKEKSSPAIEETCAEAVQRIIQKNGRGRGELIAVLEEIQNKWGYLPEEALKAVAQELGYSLVDVYGVATFYKSFSLKPRGKHLVSVCLGTACHVRSAPMIAEEFERQLGVKAGQTTPDREFTLERVNCLGACALGPIVMVDGHYFSNVKTGKVAKILKKTRAGLDKVEIEQDERIIPLENCCPHCNHSLMDAKHLVDGLPSVRITVSFERQHCGLSISALYGSYNTACEVEIPVDSLLNFFCPHCYAELISPSKCAKCSAPMIPMIVRGGGMVQVCSRMGCKEHRLDLNGVNM